MKTKLRFFSVAAFLGLALFLTGQASASVTVESDTVAGWVNNPLTPPGGDKTFTDLPGTNLPGNVFVTAIWNDNNTLGTSDDSYSLLFSGPGILNLNPTSFFDVFFEVQIAGSMTFNTAALDVTHLSGDSQATTSVFSDPGFSIPAMSTLVSTNGSPAGPNNIGAGLQTIYVHDTLQLSGGTIASFSNTFTQANAPVPEPTTLAIWGLGTLGCAIAAYRRKKQTA